MTIEDTALALTEGRIPSSEALHAFCASMEESDARAPLAWECAALGALTSGRLLHAVDALLALHQLGETTDALWSQLEAVTLNASGWAPQVPATPRRPAAPAGVAGTDALQAVEENHLASAAERLRGGLRFGVALERCALLRELDPLTVVRVLRSVHPLSREPGERLLALPDAMAAWLVSGPVRRETVPIEASRGALIGPGRAGSRVIADGRVRLLALATTDWSALAARSDFEAAAERLADRRRLVTALHDLSDLATWTTAGLRAAVTNAEAIRLAQGARLPLSQLGSRLALLCSGEARLEDASGAMIRKVAYLDRLTAGEGCLVAQSTTVVLLMPDGSIPP
ncbi:MAG: hypothetical protein EA398_11930 [Deltaproteobacteria bacterium]|nr:MAG: hypothetical protein EA398_11930 [Deltaproteobacteria bacterium]